MREDMIPTARQAQALPRLAQAIVYYSPHPLACTSAALKACTMSSEAFPCSKLDTAALYGVRLHTYMPPLQLVMRGIVIPRVFHEAAMFCI